MGSDIRLKVPLLHQKNWCACGLAAINMVMRFHRFHITEPELERNPLCERRFLDRLGFNPGRLGRIALSYGFKTTIIDCDPSVIGKMFTGEGGKHRVRDPNVRDIDRSLDKGIPLVACIPDKSDAFPYSNSRGSHWVVIRARAGGNYLINDPAPWRRATRCRPGYWREWACSLIRIEPTARQLKLF